MILVVSGQKLFLTYEGRSKWVKVLRVSNPILTLLFCPSTLKFRTLKGHNVWYRILNGMTSTSTDMIVVP